MRQTLKMGLRNGYGSSRKAVAHAQAQSRKTSAGVPEFPIAEEQNISTAHPEITREMRQLLKSARTVPQGNSEILITPPKKKNQAEK
jgi:hypothetical protein